MSKTARSVSNRAVTGNQPAADPPVTPTSFDDVAAQVSAGIAALVKLIPAFEPKHDETKQFVKRYATFSDESIRSMIAAIDANPELNSANKFDLQEGRATLQFLDAFRAVIDQVDEFHTNLRFTYFARKARVVFAVLQTYAIGKGIGRDATSAGVAAHLKNIKRDLRKPRVKRAKSAQTSPKTSPKTPATPPQGPAETPPQK
jgi:hypothetical protein